MLSWYKRKLERILLKLLQYRIKFQPIDFDSLLKPDYAMHHSPQLKHFTEKQYS